MERHDRTRPDRWLTLSEAAEYLGVSKRTLQRHAAAYGGRLLPAGRGLRFKASLLDAALIELDPSGRLELSESLARRSISRKRSGSISATEEEDA